jgi:hypothetical protein
VAEALQDPNAENVGGYGSEIEEDGEEDEDNVVEEFFDVVEEELPEGAIEDMHIWLHAVFLEQAAVGQLQQD